jgi:MoxR-like ATPase
MENKELNEEIQKFGELAEKLKNEIAKKVVGQETLIRDMIVALFAGGHILLE